MFRLHSVILIPTAVSLLLLSLQSMILIVPTAPIVVCTGQTSFTMLPSFTTQNCYQHILRETSKFYRNTQTCLSTLLLLSLAFRSCFDHQTEWLHHTSKPSYCVFSFWPITSSSGWPAWRKIIIIIIATTTTIIIY